MQNCEPEIFSEVEYVNKLPQELRCKIVANIQEVVTHSGYYMIWYFSLLVHHFLGTFVHYLRKKLCAVIIFSNLCLLSEKKLVGGD